jgi:hypothetical protein
MKRIPFPDPAFLQLSRRRDLWLAAPSQLAAAAVGLQACMQAAARLVPGRSVRGAALRGSEYRDATDPCLSSALLPRSGNPLPRRLVLSRTIGRSPSFPEVCESGGGGSPFLRGDPPRPVSGHGLHGLPFEVGGLQVWL